ncbi:MAG TPA: pyridoxal phosphate-dependent aminotransferase [Candidatus Eisenbacteria bacterium]|nr:pyridoxal phosphate-dependent aminotransferase [Candidatus Eisenbacteria bacterium]
MWKGFFMRKILTKRIQQLTKSPLLKMDSKVKAMQRAGIEVINFGRGEPDFQTPLPIKQAGKDAIETGFSHYTATAGIPELREALVEKFRKENHITYDQSEIIIGSGTRPLLYIAFQVLCEKGDEAIVPLPTWGTYVEQVKLSGAAPVFIRLVPPFKLTAKEVERKITSKTKVLLLNSPSNPTGAIIEKEELQKIAQLAIKHGIWIIADEMYEKLLFKGKYISIASLNKKIQQHVITMNGFSKTYAMTGWRIGYAAGPKEVISSMVDLQGHLTANASSISQKAALGFTKSEKEVVQMVAEFAKRRTFLAKELVKIPQLDVTIPEGSFYFFIGIKRLLGKNQSTMDWCERLLEKKHVALIPGEAFLSPGHVRLSFAAPIEKLRLAVERIKEFINES